MPPRTESGEPKHRAADFPRMDLTNPSQRRIAVRHVQNVRQLATPEEQEAGRLWYPKVQEATAKGAKELGIPHLHAAGLVAAISPNMDWERNNINAFHEMGSLSSKQWDTVRRSAEAGQGRTAAASKALSGTSLSTASDPALMKAHRILHGEDPNEVLNRRTAPKTHSFMHNIHDPEGSPHVTIDARAHDIAQNSMWPWTYTGRGISSAARRAPTRYERMEDVYRTSARASGESPTAHQAITWTTAKRLEKAAPTKSGKPRVKGVSRKRQPYI